MCYHLFPDRKMQWLFMPLLGGNHLLEDGHVSRQDVYHTLFYHFFGSSVENLMTKYELSIDVQPKRCSCGLVIVSVDNQSYRFFIVIFNFINV